LWVELTGVGCSAPASVDIRLEASFDALSWSPFASVTTVPLDANNNMIASANGQGAFPYIRARVVSLASGCTANVRYSGTVGGQGTVEVQPSASTRYASVAPSVGSYFFDQFTTCQQVLSVSGGGGRLDWLAARVQSVDAGFSGTIFVQYKIDSMGSYIPLLTLTSGASQWSPVIQSLTGLSTLASGAVTRFIPLPVEYQSSLDVQICPSGSIVNTITMNLAIGRSIAQ
jgi:hypothetical protein